MTMLDRMRRHMSWLKWSLGLVCLAFVIFYIPDFLRTNGGDAAAFWRTTKFQLLVALDRPDDLERNLRNWVRTEPTTAPRAA